VTSSINTTNIDPEFPVAGQDNNSQGFRDNFLYIKEGLESAAADITGLQVNGARLDTDNNFHGNLISNATAVNVHGLAYAASEGTNPAGNAVIDLTTAPLQFLYVNSTDLTITFRGWPAINRYASVRVHMIGDSISTKTVTLETENSGLIKFPKGVSNGFRLIHNVTKSVVGNYTSGQAQVVVDNVSELEIGFNVTAQSGKIDIGTTIADIDPVTNVVTLNKNLVGSVSNSATIAFTSNKIKTKVIEAWTYNGGATVFVNYLGEFES
jgi:hypothetical protein